MALPLAYWVIGAGLGLLGYKLYSDKPKTQTTPFQNALNSQPYQVGQRVRVPLNQLPANTLNPTMLATFNQVGATSLIVQVTRVNSGSIQGNLLSTDGPGGPIDLPTAVPLTIPNALIAGLA